jgi:competence ComEA-like helix-hairpin-helix protein
VTGVSNKWMNLYAPYFKFPNYKYPSTKKGIPVKKNDLNTASVAELDFIKGIGKVLANRIIKYRQRINGYSTLDQLEEVYGLDAHVVEAIKEQFTIVQKSKIKKLDMNRASLFQLVEIPYLSKSEARRMISLRTEKGKISWDHLKAIKGFDSLKIKRLTLYLF